MPVYRPVPQPVPGPKIAAVTATGSQINAEARLLTFSPVTGNSSVSKGANTQFSFRSSESGLGNVSKGADSRFEFRSTFLGPSTVIHQVVANTQLAFRSLFKGDGQVIAGQHSLPIFEASRLTTDLNIYNFRSVTMVWIQSVQAGWENKRIIQIVDLEMTKTGMRIDPVVIGDDFRIRRVYTGLPTGITLDKAWFTVKVSETDPDGSALIQKAITPTETITGQIVVSDTSGGTLEMFFDPTRAETLNASSSIDYVYDVQVRTTQSKIYTLEKGNISFISGVTGAIT